MGRRPVQRLGAHRRPQAAARCVNAIEQFCDPLELKRQSIRLNTWLPAAVAAPVRRRCSLLLGLLHIRIEILEAEHAHTNLVLRNTHKHHKPPVSSMLSTVMTTTAEEGPSADLGKKEGKETMGRGGGGFARRAW